jgi:hypothetical protein
MTEANNEKRNGDEQDPAGTQPADSDAAASGEAPAAGSGAEGDALAQAEEILNSAEVPAEPAAAGSPEAVELRNDLLRLQAEYVNYRKRVERDRDVAREMAVIGVLNSLMPVLDDIDAARQHAGVQRAVVADHVVVEERDRHRLAAAIGVELALSRRGEARADERQQIFARDALVGKAHKKRHPGRRSSTSYSSFKCSFRKSSRSPTGGGDQRNRPRSRFHRSGVTDLA